MLFDTSVLDRVKKRLHGEKPQEENVEDTQVIPDFSTSLLFGNVSTQEIPVAEKPTEQPALSGPGHAIKLPQLELDESDFFKPTQVIEPISQTQELTLGSTQVIPRHTQTNFLDKNDEMTQEIPEIPEISTQTATLAAELTHTSLTDEENDLNEMADTTCDSSLQKTVTTKAELQKIEQDLSEQKRVQNIQPGFVKKEWNPMQQLLDAFDSDSEAEQPVNSEQGVHLSPSTSPIKVKKQGLGESEVESDFEIDVLDLIENVHKKSPQKKKLSPIEEYAEKLKKQLNSSPTSSKPDMVVLDDSDDEVDIDSSDESDVPKLTKEQAFVIRQKFSRKNFLKTNMNNPRFHKTMPKPGNSLFNDLRRANANQLSELKKNNPDSELIEEIEKEEEEMGNLLEREMERVRRIRKKEKLMEKAQKVLLAEKSDEDYDDAKPDSANEIGSEVPDSDLDSVDYDSSEDEKNDSGSEQGAHTEKRINRSRRVVLSDDDEEEEDVLSFAQVPLSLSQKHVLAQNDERTDDSYMFGGQTQENGFDDNDDPVMQIHSDMARPESPVSSVIEKGIDTLRTDLEKLFANLPPPTATQESSILEATEPLQHETISFQDSLPTQRVGDEGSFLATQVDGPSLNGTSTQDDRILPTQQDVYSDNDEDDIHSALDNGRRRIRQNLQQALVKDNLNPEESEDEEAEEVDEEELKQRLAIYEAKIRRKELKARKLRKDMERRGLKGIVEGEAEESDDEWKGIGGREKEDSDQANSEDERMIDNTFNINLNDDEVRKKFMEQYQIKDRNELEKLMDDIKNHRLTKRSRANKFDIELSDEEDEILMAYRRQKLDEQKQRLLENQKMMLSSKSEKTKAFFECIQDEPNFAILPETDLEVNELEDKEKDSAAEDSSHDVSDAESKPKKVAVLEESFVQKQLSFLSKTDEDDYFAIQKASDVQHGVDDDGEDVSALKKKCLSSLYSRPTSAENLNESRKRPQEVVLTDDDEDDFARVFKKPSMVSSFRSYRDKNAAQVSTNSFSGVTVNKHYKVASASTASITYMSKQSKSKQSAPAAFKSSKAKDIEERVDRAKLETGFRSSRDNFA